MTRPGETAFVNSFMTLSAPLAQVADPAVLNASDVHLQLQNKGRWQRWMGMEGRAGGTVVRGFGSKLASLDALPPAVREGARERVPEIFDTDRWTQFVFEDSEFLRRATAPEPR
jgi:hypothetical protein